MTAQQLNRKFEKNQRFGRGKLYLDLRHIAGRYTSARTARAWTAFYYANK